MPAISVIIPTYNCGRYLQESLDSIFAQTERDFEVIVVDDGSTDDTPHVLDAYTGRLTVVQGAHGGLSAPHFLARGRDATVRVNTKPYRLRDLAALIEAVRAANPRIEVDGFWSAVARGEDVTKEAAATPRGRF